MLTNPRSFPIVQECLLFKNMFTEAPKHGANIHVGEVKPGFSFLKALLNKQTVPIFSIKVIIICVLNLSSAPCLLCATQRPNMHENAIIY